MAQSMQMTTVLEIRYFYALLGMKLEKVKNRILRMWLGQQDDENEQEKCEMQKKADGRPDSASADRKFFTGLIQLLPNSRIGRFVSFSPPTDSKQR